jgi:hypothetical protein
VSGLLGLARSLDPLDMLNSGDVVEYASPSGPQRGRILDVRGSGGSGGVTLTYVIGLDGVRDPIHVTDRGKLTKLNG